MSSFIRKTKHPNTGRYEDADWLDDYFGKHRYGVKFPDGKIFEADLYKWFFDTPTKRTELLP
jgi:hypothetical protein